MRCKERENKKRKDMREMLRKKIRQGIIRDERQVKKDGKRKREEERER